MISKWCLVAVCSLFYWNLTSQNQQSDSTSVSQKLEPIYIKATKLQKSWVPAAASIYTLPTELKNQLVQNSLQEYLVQSPSIFTLNANNKAQDLRISIRGFGSRSAFGVRGVKIIVDGIPETTTDGQGQLDNLNLGIIDRIEVINNGSAALYGNASGGVINIMTIDESALDQKNQFFDFGIAGHSFGGQQYQLTAGKKFKNTSVILHGNHHQGNGYREHSEFQSTNLNLRLTQKFSSDSKLEAILNYMNSPTANDPGGVDLQLFDSLPISARDRNVQFNAGESIDQFKSSIRYESKLNDRIKLNTYGFYSRRNFYGLLPFEFGGIIDLKRNFQGHGTSLTYMQKTKKIEWRSLWGYELSSQRDIRERFRNLEGVQGVPTLSQNEQFINWGFYAINDLNLDKFTFNFAFRFDLNGIEIEDQLISSNDVSKIDLNDLNYSVGASYQISENKSFFVTHSTSFETPTLNELSNNPNGSGFNPDLKPQSANHFEIGIKGYLKEKSTFQLSIYKIATKNELLPFELEAFPGRTFYRNVGNTDRSGIEAFIKHPINDAVSVSTNWNLNNFRFGQYELNGENFEGNDLPGMPDFQGFVQFDFELLNSLQLNYQNQILGKIYADDANTSFQKSKSISNVSIKYTIEKESYKLSPYFGVNNVFSAKYADNIRINAFGSRYYEAAPDLVLYGGVRVHF